MKNINLLKLLLMIFFLVFIGFAVSLVISFDMIQSLNTNSDEDSFFIIYLVIWHMHYGDYK